MIKKLFLDVHKQAFGDQKTGMRPGVFGALLNTNPIVEIAEDGKTAKGFWGVIGAGTMRHGGEGETGSYDEGKPNSGWNLCMRATDFIKEDGVWKMWHYTVHGYFCCPFDTCWSDIEDPAAMFDHSFLPKELQANKPPLHPFWIYTPQAKVRNIPAVPDPYKTFNEKDAY
jgi:hypothetical protein